MIYFALNTRTNAEKCKAQHITKELRKVFGAKNVEAIDYKVFRTIRIEGSENLGWVDFNSVKAFFVSTPLGDNQKTVKIPVEMMETLYL